MTADGQGKRQGKKGPRESGKIYGAFRTLLALLEMRSLSKLYLLKGNPISPATHHPLLGSGLTSCSETSENPLTSRSTNMRAKMLFCLF